jgi:predicted 3-demethylubiquinone-9 3-methyltransferase (glyoxalase superfamily)
MTKITPHIWFDDCAEEAAQFYVETFRDGRLINVMRPGGAGKAIAVVFELFGQHFTGINGGPTYALTPAVSFHVPCESQQEIDLYWDRLADRGQELRCGWVTDRFGVTWQIIPAEFPRLLGGDPQKAARVMGAAREMRKIDLAALRAAAEG